MNKYDSERQITKQFINESFFDKFKKKPSTSSGDEGAYTRELNRAGKIAKKTAKSAAVGTFLPVDAVEGGLDAADAYLKSQKYLSIKKSMTDLQYQDVRQLLKLMDNLQKLMKPSKLKEIYDADKSENKTEFAVNLVNQALDRVHIQGNQYFLSSPQTGFQTVHNLKRPGK